MKLTRCAARWPRVFAAAVSLFISLSVPGALRAGTQDLQTLPMLFNRQLQTLRERGVPEKIIRLLDRQRESVLKKADAMKFEKKHIPFLPVIPLHLQGIRNSVAIVRNGAKTGHTFIQLIDLSDRQKTPRDPYYIFSIDRGEETRNKNPESALKLFAKTGRVALTTAEIIALAIHTDVLQYYVVWASNSRFSGIEGIPYIRISIDGRPFLGWAPPDNYHVLFGSPSRNAK